MSINLKLTIEAMTENIRKQSERRDTFKKELLKQCPYKVGERIKLVNVNTEKERFVFILGVYVSDSGDYKYSVCQEVLRSYGTIKQATEIGFSEIVEKCDQPKKINHEHTKQRFNSTT